MSDVFSESPGFSAHAAKTAEEFYGKASKKLEEGAKAKNLVTAFPWIAIHELCTCRLR
ncbi:MAG: hypothetical protein AB7U41_06655 [Dongiaceae bacterium]